MTPSPRRVAIIGCGGIARAHAAALRQLPDLALAGVVDSHADALARGVEEFGVPGFASLDELLAADSVDVACVCTPPATHRTLTGTLLRAGIDVLCEKPLATTSGDARAMKAEAAEYHRRLSISQKFRHVADLRLAGERVRSGDIGVPLAYTVTFCAPVDVRGRWPSDPSLSGGGVLMDNGPHAFDVLGHVLDAPIDHVTAVFGRPILAPPVEDTVNLLFRTTSGSTGRIELSWAYSSKDLDYLVVVGSEGTIRVGWTGGFTRQHGECEWTPFGSGYDKEAAFRGVWTAFETDAPALRGNGDGEITDSGHGPGSVEALELVERAYATRSPID